MHRATKQSPRTTVAFPPFKPNSSGFQNRHTDSRIRKPLSIPYADDNSAGKNGLASPKPARAMAVSGHAVFYRYAAGAWPARLAARLRAHRPSILKEKGKICARGTPHT